MCGGRAESVNWKFDNPIGSQRLSLAVFAGRITPFDKIYPSFAHASLHPLRLIFLYSLLKTPHLLAHIRSGMEPQLVRPSLEPIPHGNKPVSIVPPIWSSMSGSLPLPRGSQITGWLRMNGANLRKLLGAACASLLPSRLRFDSQVSRPSNDGQLH